MRGVHALSGPGRLSVISATASRRSSAIVSYNALAGFGLRGRRLVDRLQLHVRREPLGPELAPDAARLHATERRDGIEHVVVEADRARLNALVERFAASVVAPPDAASEPDFRGAGD